MDYEDEFDENDVDIDADLDEEFRRRYRIDDSKMSPGLTDSKARRRFADNTLTTMSYQGAQVTMSKDLDPIL